MTSQAFITFVVFGTLWLGSIILAARLAAGKNRDPAFWAILTAIFGLAPLIIIYVLEPAPSRAELSRRGQP